MILTLSCTDDVLYEFRDTIENIMSNIFTHMYYADSKKIFATGDIYST